MHALAKQTDIKLPREKVGTTVGKTAGGVTDGEIGCRKYQIYIRSLYDSKMFIDYHSSSIYCTFLCDFRIWYESRLFSWYLLLRPSNITLSSTIGVLVLVQQEIFLPS